MQRKRYLFGLVHVAYTMYVCAEEETTWLRPLACVTILPQLQGLFPSAQMVTDRGMRELYIYIYTHVYTQSMCISM